MDLGVSSLHPEQTKWVAISHMECDLNVLDIRTYKPPQNTPVTSHCMEYLTCITTPLRVCLHQASASTLQQLCDDASDTVLIENKWSPSRQGLQPIFGSVIAELNRSVDAEAWCEHKGPE